MMEPIVDLIDDVISHIDDTKKLEAVKGKVNEMMADRPLFAW